MKPSFSKPDRATARGLLLVLALALFMASGAAPAEARAGGGFSFGSRGARTFSMPPSSMTAPRSAVPIQRSETPSVGTNGFGTRPTGQSPRFGFGSGLAAGLFGAGLLGILTGNGFFGGLGGLDSLLGLLCQLALVGGLIWLGLRMFRSRVGGPAFAGLGGRPGFASGDGGRGRASAGGSRPSFAVGPQDLAAFERALGEVQAAHSREDIQDLARLSTPEMVRFLARDIEANRSRGLRNEVSDVRLLQGDLAEAWSEGASQYATVAMRFGARDVMVDRTTGRVVSGDPNRPAEATELWTFRREPGGPWLLSAIQQAR